MRDRRLKCRQDLNTGASCTDLSYALAFNSYAAIVGSGVKESLFERV
jgi:hypothetical protein